MDRGAWQTAVRGVAESDTAELLTHSTHCSESNLVKAAAELGLSQGAGGWDHFLVAGLPQRKQRRVVSTGQERMDSQVCTDDPFLFKNKPRDIFPGGFCFCVCF